MKRQSIVYILDGLLFPLLILTLFSVSPGVVIPSYAQDEEKDFLGEIKDAVKNEKKHIQEILDSQTDKASRNLIIIAGAIVIPVSLVLLLWILKLLFNISFSLIRSLFSASASGVGAISKKLKDTSGQDSEEIFSEVDKPKRKPMKLGEILVNFVSRSVTIEHIDIALTEQKKNLERPLIGQLLIKLGFATAAEVDAALKIQGKKIEKKRT